MPAKPRLVDAPEILLRVEPATTPLRFSRISLVDAERAPADVLCESDPLEDARDVIVVAKSFAHIG